MRRAILVPPVVLFLFLAGCTTPRGEWAIARESLTQTQNTLVALNSAGFLSDKDFVTCKPFTTAAQQALQTADDELKLSGDRETGRFRMYLNMVGSALKSLKPFTKR